MSNNRLIKIKIHNSVFRNLQESKILIYLLVKITISSAIVLNCQSSNHKWHANDVQYTCKPQISSSGHPSVIENVTYNHLPGKNYTDFKGVNFMNQKLNVFPRNIEKFFPNVSRLSIYEGNLKNISSNDLKPFPDLVRLYISNNYIERLPGDLFQYNPKLILIAIDYNNVFYIGFNIVSELKFLEVFSFRKNPCTDYSYDKKPNEGDWKFKKLQYKLLWECPPTLEMHDVSLLESENFQSLLDDRIDSKLQTVNGLIAKESKERQNDVRNLQSRAAQMQEQIDELKNKLEDLGLKHVIRTKPSSKASL